MNVCVGAYIHFFITPPALSAEYISTFRQVSKECRECKMFSALLSVDIMFYQISKTVLNGTKLFRGCFSYITYLF